MTPAPPPNRSESAAVDVALVAATLLPLVLFACVAAFGHWRTGQETAAHVQSKVDVLHGHVAKLLEVNQVLLERMAERLDGVDPKLITRREAQYHRYLSRLPERHPDVAALTVVSKDGITVAHSHFYPIPRADLSDRDYFTAHLSPQPLPVYVSGPVLSRVSGELGFALSVRRTHPDGSFGGVYVAALRTGHLYRLWQQVAPRPGETVSLIRADGTILVRYPHAPDGAPGQLAPDSPLREFIATGASAAFWVRRSSLDGQVRHFATRKVEGFPLYVSYGITGEQAFAAWRRDTALMGGVALAATLALFALARLVRRRNRALQLVNADLRRAQEGFRMVTDHVPVLLWLTSPAGCEFANREYLEFLGVGEQDVAGLEWVRYVHPDDRDSYVRAYEDAFRRRARFEATFRFRRRDGVYRWMRSAAVPREGGPAAGYVGCTFDISDMVQAQAAQLETQQRFRVALETSSVPFVLLRAVRGDEGRVADFAWTYVNPAAAQAIRRPADELVGRNIGAVVPDSWKVPGLFEFYVRIVETGRSDRLEVRYVSEGAEVWFVNIAAKLGDGVAVWFTDTTERKRAELAMREADRRKDEFLAALAHELRNPLSAVALSTELLDRADLDEEGARQAIAVIRRQLGQLRHLVDDLLDMARATYDKLVLSRRPVELLAVADAAVAAHSQDRRGGRRFSLQGEPAWVDGDPVRLQQMVGNLVDNAVKYGGRDIRVEVRRAGGHAELVVSDDGEGIGAELLPRLFEPFTQGAQAIDRGRGGLGLGLALVHRLARLHGGSVMAESAGPGKGSRFTLRLPCIEAPAHPPRVEALAQQMQPRRVLIVEDQDDARKSLQLLLQLDGHDVAFARDGAEGLAKLEAMRPDVALVDIGLPGMDGYEVARRARRLPAGASCRLIALSGYALGEDRRKSLEAGFDLHLAKPVSYAELQGALR